MDTWPTGPGFEFNLARPIQASERACPCDASPLHRWKVTRSTDELVKRFALFGRDQGMALRAIDSLSKIEPSAFNEVGRPSRHKVYDAKGRWWEISAEQLRLACNYSASGALPAVTRDARVSSGDVEVAIQGGTATITGRGFGHGVGMCQYGAEGLARQGRSAEQILTHYYPGAQLTRSP
jgi:SpoIID/LytB domain protein